VRAPSRVGYLKWHPPSCGHTWCERETVRDGHDVAFLLWCMMNRGVLDIGDDGHYLVPQQTVRSRT